MAKKQPIGKKPAPKSAAQANLGNLKDAWNQAREKKAPEGGAFGVNPRVPDGDYIAQVTSAKVGAYKKGNKAGTPFFSLSYTIVVAGARELIGERLSSVDDLSAEVAFERNGEEVTRIQLLSERLQRMGLDVTELDFNELPQLAQQLADPKDENGRMYLSVRVANKHADNPNDPTKPYHNQNIYVNERVSEDDVEEAKERLGLN
jgi:hypothetical protein